MATITKRLVFGVLTGTQSHLLFFFDSELHRGKVSPLMGTVTEGLVRRLTAGTPEVVARLQLHHNGLFVSNYRFSHRNFSLKDMFWVKYGELGKGMTGSRKAKVISTVKTLSPKVLSSHIKHQHFGILGSAGQS